MTLPTVQPYTAGQIVDDDRSESRQRLYTGVITSYTLTVTAAATGVASYLVNGKPVSYPATVGPDTSNTVATSLQGIHVNDVEVFRIATATVATNVVTVLGRTSYDVFTVSGEAFTGAGNSLVLADTTPVKPELVFGVAVALESTESVRQFAAPDTQVSMFGIVIDGFASDSKLNTGDPSAGDAFEPGSIVSLGTKGEFPVRVSTDVAIGDPVWVRRSGAGTNGEFANADGGTHFQMTTGARWTSTHYTDNQGVKLALLTISLP